MEDGSLVEPSSFLAMKPNSPIIRLNEASLRERVDLVCEQDAHLRQVISSYGYPPLWERQPGFATLIHIILEQQVSLASAKACFDKLEKHLGVISPESFLTLSDETLLKVGFSRQKTRYSRILAQAIMAGDLDPGVFENQPDAQVFELLTKLTGIGPWTANIYLLMALGRPDIWPVGDLALVVALKDLYGLEQRPDREAFMELGKNYRPHRAVAARILWHYYLSRSK